MMEELINSYRQINLRVGEIIAVIKKTEYIWLASLLGYFIKQGSSINIISSLLLHSSRVVEVSGYLSRAQNQCLGQSSHLHRLLPTPEAQTLGLGLLDPSTLPDAPHMVSILSVPSLPLSADTEHTLSQLKIQLLLDTFPGPQHYSEAP